MNQFTFNPNGDVSAKIYQRVKYQFTCPNCGKALNAEIDWPDGLTAKTQLTIADARCPYCGADVSKQPQGHYSVVNGELILRPDSVAEA
ncbi:MAG: hypothetical protein EGQ34_02495 [Sutterella sp.]|nr:hypothetical protein [Sutterella sp.]